MDDNNNDTTSMQDPTLDAKPLKQESPVTSSAAAAAAVAGAIELARKPRGRPRGSKNKPKPPIIIEAESPSSMRAHVFEIPAGHDIVDCLTRFSRRRNIGVSVLAGTGPVANISFHQSGAANSTANNTFSFLGLYEILSIAATIMPPSAAFAPPAGFTVTVAGPQGAVVGGVVAGPLMAAGKVVLVAAAFVEPSFYKLPIGEDVTIGETATAAADDGEESEEPVVHRRQRVAEPESCAMAVYSSSLAADVVWAPTASRPPPPPPY